MERVKRALVEGGITRANKPPGVAVTPGIRTWEDLVRPPAPDGPKWCGGGQDRSGGAWCAAAAAARLHVAAGCE